MSLKDKKAARFGDVESPVTTLTGAVFSPDGRWVAYASGQGRTTTAVYVQPFPPTGARYQVSKDTDPDPHHPMWSPDGAELIFVPGQGAFLNAVRVTKQPSLTFSEATQLPKPFVALPGNAERPYDISRDGQRFLALAEVETTEGDTATTPQIQVVLNWLEELKQRVPTGTK